MSFGLVANFYSVVTLSHRELLDFPALVDYSVDGECLPEQPPVAHGIGCWMLDGSPRPKEGH